MSLKYDIFEKLVGLNCRKGSFEKSILLSIIERPFLHEAQVLLQLRFAKRNFACALQANHPFLISRFDFNCKNDRGINLKKLFNLDFIRFSSTAAVPFLCRGRKKEI